jgi:TolB protein
MWTVLFAAQLAHTQVSIVIDRGVDNPTKIAVVPFGAGPGLDVENPAGIIGFDLARSGQFAPLDAKNMLSLPVRPEEVCSGIGRSSAWSTSSSAAPRSTSTARWR